MKTNDKLKKFYYTSHKSANHILLTIIYNTIYDLYNFIPIHKAAYIIVLIINLIQSISLSFESSFWSSTHIDIKEYSRYFHLTGILNDTYMKFYQYEIVYYFNLFCIAMIYILFFSINMISQTTVKKIITGILAVSFYVEKYILFPYHISILLSAFKFTSNNFVDDDEHDIEIIFMKILSVIFILLYLPFMYLVCVLYNDFSVYEKKQLWSSPIQYVDLIENILRLYLVISGYFTHGIYVFNIVVIILISACVVYARVYCPFYFHIELNYIKFFCEGTFISCATCYSVLSLIWQKWKNYDIIFLIVLSLSLGMSYSIVIIKVDEHKIRSIHKQIEAFMLQKGSISEYDLYIFLLRISDIIKKCKTQTKSFDLMLAFYTQHKMCCSEQECHCKQIEDVVINKNAVYSSTNNEEVSLLNQSDLFEEEDPDEKDYLKQNNKPRNKHIKAWGLLIEDIFEHLHFSSDGYVKIEYANFLSFYLKKYIHSLIEISYVNPHTLPIQFRFRLHLSKMHLLTSNIDFFHNDANNTNVDIFPVLEYNRYYEKIFSNIILISHMSVDFWSELQKNIFQSEIIINNGFNICKKATKTEKYSKFILAKNPNDLRILKLYGSFLYQVLQLPEESKNLLNKAFLQLVMMTSPDVESKKNKSYDFLEDMEAAIILVNGNKENIGRIDYINHSFTNLFGYTKEEIRGRNVSCIMPRNIGKHHNNFMLNFYSTSKPKFLNHICQEIGLNKEGLIHPITIFVKIYPSIEEGIAYVGLIRKTHFSSITKGRKHVRTGLGYIMTTDDGKLLHYNKIIEEKFQLNSALMYDDTKDKSEEFSIEMIFPELTNNSTLKGLEREELRLYFTNKVIDALKRMEYSTIPSLIKQALDEYYSTKKSAKDKVAQKQIVLKMPHKHFNQKTKGQQKRRIRKVVSVSANIENLEFMKRNTAVVSLTKFSYIMNVNFKIFQIVFEKENEHTINNIIKRYQQIIDESKNQKLEAPSSITQDLQELTNVLSIQSTTNSQPKVSHGSMMNLSASIRLNTFEQKSPHVLNVISLLNIVFALVVVIEIIIEFILSEIYSTKTKKSITLAHIIQENYFHLQTLEEAMYYYGLYQINAIKDFTTFNASTHKQLYEVKIQKLLDNTVKIKDDMLQKAKYDSETTNLITESGFSFKTFYDEESYTTTNQSLASAIIIIVNYHNTLFTTFKNANSLIGVIDYNHIIANANGSYHNAITGNNTATEDDVEKNVIKSFMTIRENFDEGLTEKFFAVVSLLLQKNYNNYITLSKVYKGLFLFLIGFTVAYFFAYFGAYVVLINLQVSILKIFNCITLDSLEKCLNEVRKFSSHIEKIVQDNVFFLTYYYNDGRDANTIIQNSTTNNSNALISNRNNMYGNDFNLGMEPEVNEIKQQFSKYKKNKMISIKDFIEEQKELHDITGGGRSDNNSYMNVSQKNSELNVSNKSPLIGNNTKASVGSINNVGDDINEDNNNNNNNASSGAVISRSNSYAISNQVFKKNTMKDISQHPTNEGGDNNNNKNNHSTDLNHLNNKHLRKPIRKKGIYKKSQKEAIHQHRKNQLFESCIIAITSVVLIYIIVTYFIQDYKLKQITPIFQCIQHEIEYTTQIVNFIPYIFLSLISGEASSDTFNQTINNKYNNIMRLSRLNSQYIIKHLHSHYLMKRLFQITSDGNQTCTYITEPLSNEVTKYNSYNFCMSYYYANGEELGTNELIRFGLEYFNKFINEEGIDSIDKRRELIDSEELGVVMDYNIFIVWVYFQEFFKTYCEYFKKMVKVVDIVHINKIWSIIMIFGVVLLVYYLKIRKKYLHKTIFVKAMILLIPRDDLVKIGNSKYMKAIQ